MVLPAFTGAAGTIYVLTIWSERPAGMRSESPQIQIREKRPPIVHDSAKSATHPAANSD